MVQHEQEIHAILLRIRSWPVEDRIALAHQILHDIDPQQLEPAARRTVEHLIGIARGNALPPDDETVRRWLAEHRLAKYG